MTMEHHRCLEGCAETLDCGHSRNVMRCDICGVEAGRNAARVIVQLPRSGDLSQIDLCESCYCTPLLLPALMHPEMEDFPGQVMMHRLKCMEMVVVPPAPMNSEA